MRIIQASDLEAFKRHLRMGDLSASTIRVYVHDVKLFGDWLAEIYRDDTSLKDIGVPDLAAFRKHLIQERSLRPATVNRRINALRAFFAWLQQARGRDENPALNLRFVRRATKPRPKSLKQTEVLALMRAAGRSSHGTSQRNEALLQLMLQAGLRVAEATGLRRSDLTLQSRSGSVRVSGKGMKIREVPLNATVRRALASHLEGLGEGEPSDPIFMSKRQGPLSVRAVQHLISSLSKEANVTRIPVSAHTLRHTFAVNYLKNSPGKLVELAALMGHDSLDTTAVYLRPSEEDLSEDLEKSPLNILGD